MGVVAPVRHALVLDALSRACELYERRQKVVSSQVHDFIDLVRLDLELRAVIECLVRTGPRGWTVIEESLSQAPSSAFVVTVITGVAEHGPDLEWSIRHHLHELDDITPLTAALSWLPFSHIATSVQQWAGYHDPRWRALALSAHRAHAVAPPKGSILPALGSRYEPWRREALRTAGIFRMPVTDTITGVLRTTDDPHTRFEAALALLRCRHGRAEHVLWELACSDSLYALAAADRAIANLPVPIAAQWLGAALRKLGRCAVVVRAAASTGSPWFVPYVIDGLEIPDLAPIAGYGLRTALGLDLDSADLAIDPPEGIETDLPFPDAASVRRWWNDNRARFDRDHRWVLGRVRDRVGNREALTFGPQHVRAIAADALRHERADTRVPFNVTAAAWRQRRWLVRARLSRAEEVLRRGPGSK